MRRVTPDEPFEEGGDALRRSRVTRLVDLLDDGGKREKSSPRRSTRTEEGGPQPRLGAPRGGDGPCKGREPPGRTASCGKPASITKAVPGGRPASDGKADGSITVPTILSVTPEGSGETMAVVMVLPSEGTPGERGSRRVHLRLLVEQYADLRARGFSLECGDISEEEATLLLEAGELSEAIRRGMAALQYRDRSARRLTEGLTAKGIERAIAEDATAYLTRKGYVREEETARRRVGCNLRKGWGPRRIREDLRALGLASEAVDGAMEELSEVDFCEMCAEVIRKKYGEVPTERGERQKMTAALMRLGYDTEHIRGAMRALDR